MSHTDDFFSVDDILEEVKRAGTSGGSSKADADRLVDEILGRTAVQDKQGAENKQSPLFEPNKQEVKPVAEPKEKAPAPAFPPRFSVNLPEEPKQEKPLEPSIQAAKTENTPPIFAKAEAHFPRGEAKAETYHPAEEPIIPPVKEDTAYLQFRENREKKIKDFVLFGEEDEVDAEEAETDDETADDKVIEEFDSMTDAPSVQADIKELSTSLTVRLVLLLILFGVNLYTAAGNLFDFLPLPAILDFTLNPIMATLSSALILFIAIIVSHTTVFSGLINFVKFKADGDSLPALAVFACLVECVVFLIFPDALEVTGVHLYSFAAVLGLLFNCAGKMLIVKRTALNFKYVTADCDKYAVTLVEDEHLANDFTKGLLNNIPVTATNRKTKFLSGFLDMSFREDIYDAICRRLAPIVFAAAVILAVGCYVVSKNAYVTMTAVTAVFVICSSLFGLFSVNRPMLDAVKQVHKHGGMIIGYPAVEEFADVNSATVEGHDLFPAGTVILHGIKTFKGMRIDNAILDAASILVEANSILSDIFMQVIQGKPELLKKVDTIVYEDMMGISGWVDNKRVLIGSRELLLNHGIDVPSKDYEKRYCTDNHEIVYLSTSGELTAAFIISLTAAESVRHALRQMENNDIFCIVKTVDPILTKEKLAAVFDTEQALFRVLPSRLHKAYNDRHCPSEREEGFLADNGGLYSYIRTLTVTKRVRARIMLGIVVLISSIIIGFGLVTVFALTNGLQKLNVMYLAAYQLIWLVVAWLIQKCRTL